MTGIININAGSVNHQDVAGAGLNPLNGNAGVNADPNPVAPGAGGLASQFEVFERDNNLFVNTDEEPLLSASMLRKFESVDQAVQRAVDGEQDLNMEQMFTLLAGYSEKSLNLDDAGKRLIFQGTDESRALDHKAVVFTMKLLEGKLFSKLPDNEDTRTLKADTQQLLMRLMKGNYDPEGRQALLDRLPVLVNRLKTAAGTIGDAGARQKAELLADDVGAAFSRIMDNRIQISRFLRVNQKSGDKITFSNVRDVIGMGYLLTSVKKHVDDVFEMPKVTEDQVLEKIALGQTTLESEAAEHPEYGNIFREYSSESLKKLQGDLEKISQSADDKGIRARLAAPLDPATDAGGKVADEIYGNLLTQIRDLNLVNRDAANHLSVADRATLFAGGSVEDRIVSRLDLLKQIYAGRPDCVEALDKLASNRDTLAAVLETVSYSPSLFRALVENPGVIDSLIALKTANSDAAVREIVSNVCTIFALQIPFAGNTIPAALLQNVPAGDLSESAALVLHHLPARYELTSDALACINYVLNGDTSITRGVMDITLDDLKNAYKSVCNASRDLKNVLKEAGLSGELQNVENILLKAAYHQYVSDNAGDPTRIKAFPENDQFKAFMGITADGAGNTVAENRYKGFDPTVVNTLNTDVGTFLKVFNIMMSHSGFISSCEKIPAVHLDKRLSEALETNIDKIFDLHGLRTSRPDLVQAYENAATSRDKVQWYKDNLAVLTRFFIDKNKTSLDDIVKSNVTEIERQRKVIADLGLKDLLNFSRTVSSSKVGAASNSPTGADNVDDLFREINKVKGSESLGYLISTINHLTLRSVFDLLPENRTFLGLKREDFLNPAKLNDIKTALSGADPAVMETLDFKLCFEAYAKLRLRAEHQGNLTVADLESAPLTLGDIRAAIGEIRQLPDQAPENLVDSFVALEREADTPETRLENFCFNNYTISDTERLRILENLELKSDMFTAENNIFVRDKAEGKKKMEALKKALKTAISALKVPRADSRAIMAHLARELDSCLAGSATRSLANTLVSLSPYFHPQEVGQENVARTIELRYRSIFRKGDTVFRAGADKLASNFLGIAREPSQSMMDLLSGMQTKKHDADEKADALLKNSFFGVVMENALRKVAYDNGFPTFADFKYEMTSKKVDAKGKSRSDLIREVADVASRTLRGVDQGTLMKLALKITESDDYMNHITQDTTKRFTRSVRRLGRLLGRSKIASFGRSVGRFFSSIFRSKKKVDSQLQVCSLTAENTLLSIKPGTSLIYTKENHLSVGVGFNVTPVEVIGKVGVNVEFKMSADSKLEIQRTGDGNYIFLLAAGLAGKLGLNVGAKDKITAGLDAEIGAGMQRGYAVTFADKDQAVKFLSKVMVAGVEVTDFQKALEIRKDASKNIGGKISAELKPVSIKNLAEGKKDDSKYDTVQVSASISAGLSGEWLHQRGNNYHTYSKTVNKSFALEANVTVNVQQELLKNVDPTTLTDDDKKKYYAKMGEIKSVDKMIHLLTDKKSALKEFVTDKKILDRFSSHEYSPQDKLEWKKKDDFEKYRSDPGRMIAEALLTTGDGTVGDPLFSDLESFQKYLIGRIPGLRNAVELKERLDKFLGDLLSVINRLNNENLRFNADLKLGKDSQEVASFSVGMAYSSQITTTFDTNLMQTDLRRAERKISIAPDKNASPETAAKNNVKLLSAAMKKAGFSSDQISKAVVQLQQLITRGEKITGFELVKTASKETLANFKKTVPSHREAPSMIGKFMDKLSDSSLEPTKVVFTTVKSVDSQSFSLKGGAFLKVGVGTEENLNRNMSYEVTF